MAGNATARIYITGDASGVGKAARDAERALGRLSGSAKASFGRMTEVAGGFGLAMGVGGVLGAVQDSVKAYNESVIAQTRMSAQLDTIGQNSEKVTAKINDTIAAQQKFGAFDDEALMESFTRILRVTGDVDESLRLNQVAMDVARARGIDLAAAGDAVAKAYNGQGAALRRMGVAVDKTASGQEILAAAQKQFAGQAKTYGESSAGAAERAQIAWENVQEQVGEKMSAAFTKGALGAERMAGGVDDLVGAMGGFKNVAIAGGVFAGIRTFGGPMTDAGKAASGFATQLGKIKQSAGWGAAIRTAARTSGSALVNLAGGPMAVAGLAAAGLVLGIQKLNEEMTTSADEARDTAQAIKELGDAQLDAQGAALDTEQAELNLDKARKNSRNALSQLHQAEAGMRRVRKQHLEDTPAGIAALGKYRMAVDHQKQAQLDLEQAYHRVNVAKHNQQQADAAAVAAGANLAKQLRGQIEASTKVGEKMAGMVAAKRQVIFTDEAAKQGAKDYADQIVKMAHQTEGFTQANYDTAAAVANVVRDLGRVPTETEANMISNAIATGGDIEDLKRKLGLIPPTTPANVNSNAGAVKDEVDGVKASLDRLDGTSSTVWIHTVRDGHHVKTGGAIAGTFDGKDDVPVNVSRGEVILNPTQISMIGASRVYGALRATGAPMIHAGGSFKGGGAWTGTAVGGGTKTWKQIMDEQSARYSASFNVLDARLASAEHQTPDDVTDDNAVRAKMRALIERRISWLRRWVGRMPAKTRGDVWGEIASLTRSLDQYADLKPDTATVGADTADLEAQLRQANARADAATRNLGLSEAALGAFGGYGAGAGRSTTIVNVHSIFPPTPDQFRSGAAFMADAFGRQPYRRTPRIRIGA